MPSELDAALARPPARCRALARRVGGGRGQRVGRERRRECRPWPGTARGGSTSRTAGTGWAGSRRSGWPWRSPSRSPAGSSRSGPAPRPRAGSSGCRCRPGRSAAAGGAPRRGCATAPARRTSSGTAPWPRTPRAGSSRSCSPPPGCRRPARRPAGRCSRAAAGRPAPPRPAARGPPAPAGADPPARSSWPPARAPTPARRRARCPSASLGEQLGQLRLGLQQLLPGRLHVGLRLLDGALGGRQVVQVLEHRVHHGAAGGVPGRRLGQPVDAAEPVQQRAGLEVRRPATATASRRSPAATAPARPAAWTGHCGRRRSARAAARTEGGSCSAGGAPARRGGHGRTLGGGTDRIGPRVGSPDRGPAHSQRRCLTGQMTANARPTIAGAAGSCRTSGSRRSRSGCRPS